MKLKSNTNFKLKLKELKSEMARRRSERLKLQPLLEAAAGSNRSEGTDVSVGSAGFSLKVQ